MTRLPLPILHRTWCSILHARKGATCMSGNFFWRLQSYSKQNIMCPSLSQNVAHWCNDSIFAFPYLLLRSSFLLLSLFLRCFFVSSSIDLRLSNEETTKGERRTNENISRIEREHIENLSISKTHNFSCFFVVCTFTYQFHEGVVSFTMC